MFDQRLPDKKGTIKVEDARDWKKKLIVVLTKAQPHFDLPAGINILININKLPTTSNPLSTYSAA